jgi:nucleotide-binding universal stress UspA family protein
MPGITVGIDGSHDAHRALEWSMREAAARHVPLTVLTVHDVPVSGWTGGPIIFPADEPALDKLRQAAEEAVAKAAALLGESKPASVRIHAVNGFPAQELIEASRDADLLVVGLPGRWRVRAAVAGLHQRSRDAPRPLPGRRRAWTRSRLRTLTM